MLLVVDCLTHIDYVVVFCLVMTAFQMEVALVSLHRYLRLLYYYALWDTCMIVHLVFDQHCQFRMNHRNS